MPYTRRAGKQPGSDRSMKFCYDKLSIYTRISGAIEDLRVSDNLTFVSLVSVSALLKKPPEMHVVLDVPLPILAHNLPSRPLKEVIKAHGMRIRRTTTLDNMIEMSDHHFCIPSCSALFSLFLRPQYSLHPPTRPIVNKIEPPRLHQ